jgi:hypothetical protein
VEQSRPYLDLAIEALRFLDSGNRVIERCLEYLNQLLLAMNALSELPHAPIRSNANFALSVLGVNLLSVPAEPHLVNSATSAYNKSSMAAGVDSIPAPSVFQPSMSSDHSGTNAHSSSRNFADSYYTNMSSQNQPSLGIDLGEFMVDSDLDFLSGLFDISHTGSHNVDNQSLDSGGDPTSARGGQ